MIGRLFRKGSGELTREESDAFVEQIRQTISNGDIRKAIKKVKQHQLRFPHDKPGICNSAIAISTAGSSDAAAKILILAIETNPDEPILIGNLAAAYYLGRRNDLALEYAREAVVLGPDIPQAIKLLADILTDLDEAQEAKDVCKEYLSNYTPDCPVQFKVGVCEMMLDAYDEAIRSFELALELNPKHFPSLANLGAAWIAIGDFDQAEQFVLKSLELYPDYGVSLCNLANIFESRDLHQQAFDLYKRSTEVDPGYESAYSDLERLRELLDNDL